MLVILIQVSLKLLNIKVINNDAFPNLKICLEFVMLIL